MPKFLPALLMILVPSVTHAEEHSRYRQELQHKGIINVAARVPFHAIHGGVSCGLGGAFAVISTGLDLLPLANVYPDGIIRWMGGPSPAQRLESILVGGGIAGLYEGPVMAVDHFFGPFEQLKDYDYSSVQALESSKPFWQAFGIVCSDWYTNTRDATNELSDRTFKFVSAAMKSPERRISRRQGKRPGR